MYSFVEQDEGGFLTAVLYGNGGNCVFARGAN